MNRETDWNHRTLRVRVELGYNDVWRHERFRLVGTVPQSEANQIMARAFESGVNLFDRADTYSDGLSEEITGEALRSLKVPRERFLVATKVFGEMGAGPNENGAWRAHIMDGVKASLKRLGFDHRPVSGLRF